MIINVGHPERSTALETALTATLRSQFRTVLRDPAQSENTQLVATDAPGAGAGPVRAAVAGGAVPSGLVPLARDAAGRLAPGLDGGEVYTDDRAPIEWLIDASLAEVASDGSR